MSDPAHFTEIERIATIGGDDFYHSYMKSGKPVIITEIAKEWPAVQRWSFDFFSTMDADVHIEEGNVMQGQTRFFKQNVRSYIQQASEAGVSHQQCGQCALAPCVLPHAVSP